jgi:hypothetical protein
MKLCYCSDRFGLVGELFIVDTEEECKAESEEDWICDIVEDKDDERSSQ